MLDRVGPVASRCRWKPGRLYSSGAKQQSDGVNSCAQMSADMATDHVNGNGTEEPMDTTAAVSRSEHFPALLEAGLPPVVAEKLDEFYVAGVWLFVQLKCQLLDGAPDHGFVGQFPLFPQCLLGTSESMRKMNDTAACLTYLPMTLE